MKNRVSLIINIIIAVIVPVVWGMMMLNLFPGQLTASGLRSLRYFTVLSNLFCGAMAVVYLISTRLCTRSAPQKVQILKYAAAVSVGLTFTVVVVFLSRLYGFIPMFTGVGFWMHLIVPVLAMIDFCLFDGHGPIPFKLTPLAVVPMFLYGIYYVSNLLINGIGEWPNTNDWYGFAQNGMQYAALAFAVVAVVTWLIALILRKLSRKGSSVV